MRMRIKLSLYSSESDHENCCSMAWIFEKMKPKCLGREKRKKKNKKGWRQQKQHSAVKEISLKEWFSYENKGFKGLSADDCPPVAYREGDYFYDSGDYSFSVEPLLTGSGSASAAKGAYSTDSVGYSFSLEKLLKNEDVDAAEKGSYGLTRSQANEEEKEFYTLNRNQSCKERKRVSFREPEVSDIIVLNTPACVQFEEPSLTH